MFDDFTAREVPTDRGTVLTRCGGSGPPLLLLHGYPQTHLMWHAAAERLARHHTVVAADLPGYGASFRPVPTVDHAAHSKRALAADLVQAMAWLGHDAFAVAGHDRGGRVAYRMALDHPDRVTAAAVLDVVPTGEVWSRADARMAVGYWHWAFLAQPAPLPERLIGADPDAFFDLHVRALGLGGVPDRYPPELMTAYRELLDDQSTVQAICEDYRAGAGVDRDHDDADRGHHLIACPLLVLWSAHGALPRFYGDVLDVWRPWADRVAGEGLDASHFLVEDQPDRVADLLSGFLQREGPAMTDDSLAPAPPRDALAGTLARTEIQRAGSSLPGREIVQVRTDIPVGVASGWHTHPGEEVGYILAGTVQMEIDGHPTRVLTAGDGFLVPPRVAHNATDLGPGTGQMLSTYIVEIGEPISAAAP